MEKDNKNKPPRTLDEFLNDVKKTNLDDLSDEHKKSLEELIETSAEMGRAPIKQKEELEKQTVILEEAKAITAKNAEYTKQIAEYTIRNEKASNKQFWASTIIASAALLVSIVALFK